MKNFYVFITLMIMSLQSFSQSSFKVGDKVEAWNVTWYKATILEVGTGQRAGYYKVHYDDVAGADQYLNASSIRSRKVAEEEAAKNSTAAGPRAGKYSILSYGAGNNPLRIGSFELGQGGSYTYYDMANKKLGDGKYTYDGASKQVTWVSGPFKSNGFKGSFAVSRAGKTHTIRLKSTTIGTNSTD